jgi:UDP-N-acetylglucosamine acyltransferase
MSIHPTAIIDRHAEIDPTAEIGPYVVIDGPVRIGARTRVIAHAWLTGWTTIGQDCTIFPFASIGALPQDFHHTGERSYCRLGDRVTVREGVTIHRGTQPESETIIGDDCNLLVQVHIGHNVVLHRGVTIIVAAALGGHVEVHDKAVLSSNAVFHQFVRVGELAMIAANSRVSMDVPPFMMAHGESAIVAHNVIGMRRAGYDHEAIHEIREAYRLLYRSGQSFGRAVEQLAGRVRTSAGQKLVAFLTAPSKRGIAGGGYGHRPRGDAAPAPDA